MRMESNQGSESLDFATEDQLTADINSHVDDSLEHVDNSIEHVDDMEGEANEEVQIYDDNGTTLVLNSGDTIMSTMNNSDSIGTHPIIISRPPQEADLTKTVAQPITIGQQMFIIRQDSKQSENHITQRYVLQPRDVPSMISNAGDQGETIIMQGIVQSETHAESEVPMSQVNFTSGPSDENVSQVGVSYQALQPVDPEVASNSIMSTAGGPDGTSEQGETITISLEEATQIILQQQGLGGTVQLSDGTYQILGQHLIQVTREDGSVDTQALTMEVVQALSSGLVGYAQVDSQDGQSFEDGGGNQTVRLLHTQVEMAEASNSNDEMGVADIQSSEVTEAEMSDGHVVDDASPMPQESQISSTNGADQLLSVKHEPVDPKPDLNCPIEVTERTEVMIKGKKCLLMQNPETKQLCAYPILPPEGKKRRGRPKKSRSDRAEAELKIVCMAPTSTTNTASYAIPFEKELKKLPVLDPLPTDSSSNVNNVGTGDQNSAAEVLLELSNAGPDSLRRSGRKRKKAKVFEDYDVLEASSEDEEGEFSDDEKDPDVTMYGVIKKKKLSKDAQLPNPFMMPMKRGRGRPRRYPPPGQSSTPSSIPAVILPGANGQTLVMAPIQGLQHLPGFHTTVKTHLQQLMPKPSSGSLEQPLPVPPANLGLGPDGDGLPLDPSAVLDGNGILPTGLSGESMPLGGESSDTQEGTLESGVDKDSGEGQPSAGGDQKPTVIQIPDNLLPMFGIKKEIPIKIGLKASESDLEKMKCPKCDFQAYYLQQYQTHIASHATDIHKCKCCNFLTFNKNDLLHHFKANHPRCICDICEFMAEHAYMIKRHMMRHNANGCTCEVCGKVYKDQYILKMHVKMVHMPAEVLFECTVCGKKFTRKAHLKRHLRIHDPEKPFKCPHCDYRGCERSDISKHLLIHEDPKHVCEVCGKAFRHIKNKELHVKRHNGQRDYKCGVCDFFGYTFTDIRKHIERKHADIKTMVCERCAMPFKSEYLLREHQRYSCEGEVLMIEQALAIGTSSGGTGQATIQIPSSFAVDGQHITIDGQHIAVDGGQVNITVEQVADDSLSEDQMGEGRVTPSGHAIDSSDTSITIMPHDMEEVVDMVSLRVIPMNKDKNCLPGSVSETE